MIDNQEDRSAAELVKQFSEQTSRLVRQEIALARLEVRDKIKHAGIGAGLFGGAGVLVVFGVATLVACAVLVLATAIAAWLAALIVAVALFAIAGVMAVGGRKQVAQAAPPAPEEAIENVRADIQEVKAHARS